MWWWKSRFPVFQVRHMGIDLDKKDWGREHGHIAIFRALLNKCWNPDVLAVYRDAIHTLLNLSWFAYRAKVSQESLTWLHSTEAILPTYMKLCGCRNYNLLDEAQIIRILPWSIWSPDELGFACNEFNSAIWAFQLTARKFGKNCKTLLLNLSTVLKCVIWQKTNMGYITLNHTDHASHPLHWCFLPIHWWDCKISF